MKLDSNINKNPLSPYYYYLLFGICLATHVCVSFLGWDLPILTRHGFRQTQTAISTYYLIEEGFRIDYITPVLGAPWSIPLEFPIYQWSVAAFAILTKMPLDQAGKFVSLVFFYLTLIPAYFLFDYFELEKRHRFLILCLVLSSPIYLFWSHTFMIETAALFFSLSFLTLTLKFIKQSTVSFLLLASLFGTLGGLTKITTFCVSCLPAALIFIGAIFRELLKESERRSINLFKAIFTKFGFTKILSGMIIFIVPLAISQFWTIYANYKRLSNPFGRKFLGLDSLHKWNFGTLDQRLSWSSWPRIFRITNEMLIITIVVIVISLVLIRAGKHLGAVSVFYAAFLSGPLAFTNLYYVHDYYLCANTVYFLFALGLTVIAFLQYGGRKAVVARTFILILIIGVYWRYYDGYYRNQMSSQPALMQLSDSINKHTGKADIVLIYDFGWNSTLPYYSRRKALMGDSDLFLENQTFKQAINNLGSLKIGAMVIHGDKRGKTDFIKRRISKFNFSPTPVFQGLGDLYVTQENYEKYAKTGRSAIQ